MKLAQWFEPPRIVLTLFIALMTVCALALGWLGWQVVVQDRAMDAQRRQEQVERAADRAVAAMARALAIADVNVTVTASGDVDVTPSARLAYVPLQTVPVPDRAEVFAAAEALEFSKQDRSRAADAYRQLAESSPDAQLRAEALMRLARVRRREGRWTEALQAYASLEKFGAARVTGMPASLVARTAHCSTLAESGDGAAARREAAVVWADLTFGKWRIPKATLETYLSELKALAPDLALPADWDERMALAAAAQWAFEQQEAVGRGALDVDSHAVSVSWEREASAWKARLTAPATWRALWTKLERDTNTVLRVSDTAGHVVHGGPPNGRAAYRAADMTGLPWSISATEGADPAPSQSWTARRRLLVAGLLVFALLVGAGSFLVARAMGREFAVSRLQSDFVSAVSHEFRTPLTSIRQLAEMLARGRVASEPHKQRAYELVLAESDRLRRLVESLLDFGRMQAGAYTFRRDDLEAVEWVRAVAAEFQETVRSQGYVVDFTAPADNACLCGDREALGGALWNLLDNAVKYSPDAKHVEVAVSNANGSVEVSVRDHGSGITREDLRRVFGKFFRGANARTQGTRGTGIGLAMVKEIVEAHGGMVRVHSEPGRGSEFTMVLPCHES